MKALARTLVLAAAVVLTLGMSFEISSAQNPDDLWIIIEPAQRSVVLGESLDLAVAVTNNASIPTEPLVVHLDVVDPTVSKSVDPEDWTPTLSTPIGSLAPGETATVHWTVQPVAGGVFSVYAVVLSPGSANTSVSNVMEVAVADRRSLNPSGILPVAVGAPAVVGGLLLLQRRGSRRRN